MGIPRDWFGNAVIRLLSIAQKWNGEGRICDPVSVMMLILQLSLATTLAFYIQPANASGTIYIRGDGSVDPPDAPITNVGNVSYTLTADLSSGGIVIERGSF